MKKQLHIFYFFFFLFASAASINSYAQKNPVINIPICTCHLNASVTQSVTCHGGNDGIADANGGKIGTDCSGSTGTDFTDADYSWNTSPVQNKKTATGLPAGTYIVSWDDGSGDCALFTRTVTVTEPTAISAGITHTNENCNQNDGTASVTGVSGGTGGYTYSWTFNGNPVPSATTAAISGLTSGNYVCTIKDANNCSFVSPVITVNNTNPPTANVASSTNVKCSGGSDGTASATAASGGGGGPYTYTWNPGAHVGQTVTGLTAQTYTLTVKGSNGCTATDVVTITQPMPIGYTSIIPTSETCGNGNGSAVINGVGGGTPGYTYTWSPYGGNAATANNLSQGNFTVTVKDANNCSLTVSVTVGNTGSSVTANAVVNGNVSCKGGNNGSASVNPSGGQGPYTYTWSPYGSGQTDNALTAGTYTIAVTDANGCTAVPVQATISEPTFSLTATASQNQAATCGNSNGSAIANPSGGTPGYTYSWSPSGGNGQTTTPVPAGNYNVTVWDNKGCSTTAAATVSSTGGFTANANTVTNVSCFGGSNGSATASPTGGSPNFTYSWNSSPVQNTQTANNLPAGNYMVTITDGNNCVATHTVNITQPTAVTSNVTTNPAKCGNNVGTASANAGGGTPGYTYSWAPSGGSNSVASNLAAGNYTVTVTDSKGCIKTSSGNVASTPPVSANISSTTTVSCNGGNNGAATVTVTVGSPNYTYSWNSSPVQNTQTANNLTAGNYTVTVTDMYGCTKTNTVSITQPAVALTASVSTNPTSCAVNNGTALASPNGGTGTYTYSWSTAPVQTSSTATGLGTGNYTVTVHDANNCSKTATATITYSTSVTASISSTSSVTCNGGNNGSATVNASSPNPPYNYSWSSAPAQTTQTATGLTAGNYTVTVTDNVSCVKTVTVTISQPAAITATVSATQTPCGQSTGTASAPASGGTGALTYAWSTAPVQTTSTATGLVAGGYTITVKDANNCTKTFTALVTNTNGPTVSVAPIVNVSCYGGSNGSAIANVSGGSSPYTYSWSPSGGTTSAASNLTAGNYVVTVTDASVCITSQTLTITSPAQIDPHITTASLSICRGSSATIQPGNTTGGTPGYSYSWSPSASLSSPSVSNPVANPTSNTVYTVTITDSKSCTGTGTVSVTVHQLPAINAGPDITICSGDSTQLSATGAINYVWSPSTGLNNPNISNPVATPTAAITYTVMGTDSLGCSNSDAINIQFAPTLTVSIAPSSTTVCSGTSVTLNASSNASNYLWSTGQTTASASVVPTATTTYSLTVSSGSCSKTSAVTITTNATPVAAINGNAVLCTGQSETLTATAGNYGYSWNTGSSASSILISPISNTSYTVTVSSTVNSSCKSTATFSVTVAPLPVITTSATYSTICVGSAKDTLKATGGANYLWSPGGGTTSSIVVSFGSTGSTTYTVLVTSSSGCTKTSTITINATSGFAVPAISPISSLTVCIGDPVHTFTATPNPSTNGIAWVDENNIVVQGDTFTPPQNLSPGTHTFYCVQGTGTSCLSSPAFLYITVNPLPTAAAGKDVTICPGYNTQLQASGGTSYLWSPPAGLNNPAIANPSASPQLTTTYEVMVADANNCRDKDSITVNVVLNDTCLIIIYNLISPNGDGKNDGWWIDGIKFFPDNDVRMFNRWGAKVWEGKGYDNDQVMWRGQNQHGEKLPDGTYYYVIALGDKTLSGFVELVH